LCGERRETDKGESAADRRARYTHNPPVFSISEINTVTPLTIRI